MRWLAALVAFWFAALPALAQDAATLVADSVFLNGNSTLTAEGSVEVLYRGARLTASRIVYDRDTDLLSIEGPIQLTDGTGTVLLASAAELSRDLRDGVLTSARMVLQDQLQLAANAIRRADGRYTTLDRVVASSCQVCAAHPVPLWEIRARRVTHDQLDHRLTFDDAQLRIAGLPVFWLPRLRLPDPTVERATGFLAPVVRTNSLVGPGLKLPYFIALGDNRDITLTPYFATSETRTLGLRYRQAFRTGNITVTGSASRDSILPGQTRGYLFADGAFRLPRDFGLRFSLQDVTDPAYLSDYGIASDDRLASGITISRTRRNEHVEGRAYRFRSIRAGESNATLPTAVGDLLIHRRFTPGIIGGEGGFRFELHGQNRTSRVTTDTDGDGQADGRDVARASAALDWRRSWVLPSGIVASGLGEVAIDIYSVSDDILFPASIVRTVPAAAVELRWPFVRNDASGVSHVIEPVAQIAWSPDSLTPVPNEDSRIVEFDEGNLFSLNRFPGSDGRERGLRANLGIGWTRYDPAGWSLGILAGRVFRNQDLGQFTAGSGLDGTTSDWLVAANLATSGGLSLSNRALFDDRFSFAKDELRLAWAAPRYDITGSYVWMLADPAEGRPADTSELTLDAGWQISDGWRGTLGTRYDIEAGRAARAALGLQYRTECATVDMSLSRRFTSSASSTPVTDFNLSVGLSGFGKGQGAASFRRSCGP